MTIESHPRLQKPPLCYRAEIVEKRHKSLSDDCNSQSKAGKVGLLEKTVAFMGPLIYDKSSSGNQDAVIKKAAAISFDSGVWDCASHGQLGLLWGGVGMAQGSLYHSEILCQVRA